MTNTNETTNANNDLAQNEQLEKLWLQVIEIIYDQIMPRTGDNLETILQKRAELGFIWNELKIDPERQESIDIIMGLIFDLFCERLDNLNMKPASYQKLSFEEFTKALESAHPFIRTIVKLILFTFGNRTLFDNQKASRIIPEIDQEILLYISMMNRDQRKEFLIKCQSLETDFS